MQTFLPYADFANTARVLDQRRLGKQRVEALQVQRALIVPGYGWRNHPAVRMWDGHPEALAAYGVAICREWCGRGFKDTCLGKIVAEAPLDHEPRAQRELKALGLLPPWLGNRRFHRSHQSLLVRKDPAHYGPKFPAVPDDLEAVWPPGADPAGRGERGEGR